MSTRTHWYAESGLLDIYVFLGPSAKDVMAQYSILTGRPQLPPQFSLAYHQCRWNYRDEEDVDHVDDMFDEHDIPYDVLWLDIEHTDQKKYFTWDNKLFPTPKRMIDDVASKGRNMVTIVDPHIKRDSDYPLHAIATQDSLYVKTKEGSDFEGHCWPGASSYLDFLNPKAREAYAKEYVKYHGATHNLHTWNDMNEPSVFNGPEMTLPKDVTHDNGNVEHREIHNIYGLMHVSIHCFALYFHDIPQCCL
jgi:alpha 1,3-glucosidase